MYCPTKTIGNTDYIYPGVQSQDSKNTVGRQRTTPQTGREPLGGQRVPAQMITYVQGLAAEGDIFKVRAPKERWGLSIRPLHFRYRGQRPRVTHGSPTPPYAQKPNYLITNAVYAAIFSGVYHTQKRVKMAPMPFMNGHTVMCQPPCKSGNRGRVQGGDARKKIGAPRHHDAAPRHGLHSLNMKATYQISIS